jgi:hypothetical protein
MAYELDKELGVIPPVKSIPPLDRKVTLASIVAHTMIDALVIIVIFVLILVGKMPVEWGVSIICLIAGIWAKMQKGSLSTPPDGGLIIGLATGGIDIVKSLAGK